MALTFHPPQKAIELAMQQLKADGLVHPDAQFNAAAPDGLRREVTYRDVYFTRRLGNTPMEVEVVDGALELLKSQGLVETAACYNTQAFENLRQKVKTHFTGSWTSFSPTMARLIYMLSSVKQAKRLVELGSFWGYTLAWFAGPYIGKNRQYQAEKIYGVDIDVEMTKQACENFSKLPNCEALELIAEDARSAADRIAAPIDILYLEAKVDDEEASSKQTECLYLTLLKQMYDKLPKGAWVLAHDNMDYMFQEEVQTYLDWVRDPQHFSESICFDIDDCGLELSIK